MGEIEMHLEIISSKSSVADFSQLVYTIIVSWRMDNF